MYIKNYNKLHPEDPDPGDAILSDRAGNKVTSACEKLFPGVDYKKDSDVIADHSRRVAGRLADAALISTDDQMLTYSAKSTPAIRKASLDAACRCMPAGTGSAYLLSAARDIERYILTGYYAPEAPGTLKP